MEAIQARARQSVYWPKIDDTIKEFSFMVKLAPNIGFMANVVKEVSIIKACFILLEFKLI